MPQCQSFKCGRWAHDEWDCCAFCETSLPGKVPTKESNCDHDFVLEGRFCILCGYDPEVGDRADRNILLLQGVGAAAAGLLLTIFSYLNIIKAVSIPFMGPRLSGTCIVAGIVIFGVGVGMVLKATRISS